MMAVSYTHLDVYKRQVFVSPLGDDNGAFTYSAQGFGAMNAWAEYVNAPLS